MEYSYVEDVYVFIRAVVFLGIGDNLVGSCYFLIFFKSV